MQGDSTTPSAGPPSVSIAVEDRKTVRANPPKARAEGLNFWYGSNHALKGIDLSIPEHQVTALIGPSGCGKSTFLRCFNRMHDLQPETRYKGEIMLRPDDINLVSPGVDPIEVRMRIGMVFQKPNPFPKTVFENVAYGLRLRGVRNRTDLGEKVEGALRAAAIWDEVKDRLYGFGARAVGRSDAAALHRTGARDAARDPAVRRAHVGARSDRHREDRGADLASCAST